MDVVPRRYPKTNYEIIDVGYKAPACKQESELARQNRVLEACLNAIATT